MKFDYGKEGLEVELDPDWNVTVFHPSEQESYDDPIEKIRESINKPIESLTLKEIIKNKKKLEKVCIVASDATRPVPSHLILEALIAELNDCGINDNQIIILIATGFHRTSREEELERILGNTLFKRIKSVDHVATDENSLINIGKTTDKHPTFINKHYYEADLKILTGYVEPQFFFGFSGGRKSIIPGIADAETIKRNHSAENIASPNARFGIFEESKRILFQRD